MTPQEKQAGQMPYKSITRFDLKSRPEYALQGESASEGGRQYGRYAELEPAFAVQKPRLDAAVKDLWGVPDRSWASLREKLRQRGQRQQRTGHEDADIDVWHSTVRARDGAEIKLRTMRRSALDGGETSASQIANGKGAALLVLRMHGGGWCLDPPGGSEEAEDLRIAEVPNVVLVRVSYRLAPEYIYPHALNDCYDVLLWYKLNADDLGIDPERILLIGSDAGASLAASVALKARDKGVTGIVGQVLNFPMTCHPKFHSGRRLELRSYEQNADATTISAPLIELFYDSYVPDAEEDPYHSPLLADSFFCLPPALVQVAGFDPLRDEGIAFSERLRGQGIPAELHVYKGLPHGFPDALPELPQTHEFSQRQDDFIRKCAERKGVFSARSA